MATLPTFDDLSDEQIAHIMDAFKPYETASEEECKLEYLRWLRSKVLPEVQRRLYIRLHSGMEEKEQEIKDKSNFAIPDLEAVEQSVEGAGQ